MAQPVSDAEIGEIRRLHADGRSANAIGRELGRSATTITRVCKRLGLSFDRSQVAEANQARAVDFAARRAVIQQRYLDIAEELQQRAVSTADHAQPAGADGAIRRWTTERPEPREVADLLRAATAATAAELRLADYRARDSHDDARDVVLQFALAVRNAELPDDAPPAG
jgi:hypothetical protein